MNHPVSRMRLWTSISVLVIASLACSLFGNPSPAPQDTALPAVVNTPTPIPSPTPMLGLNVPLVDDGAPLAPQVIDQKPAAGQAVALNGNIEVTFDQPMNADATAGALQVLDELGQAVAGTVSWLTPQTLQFSPSTPLTSGGVYVARLNNNAVSAQGVPVRDAVELRFTAVGELQVNQVFPTDGTQEVAADTAITAIFNRPVVPLVIAEEQANLPSPLSIDPPVTGEGEWVNTSVYVFRPATALAGSTPYHMTISAGLADALGESTLAAAYSWQFTTAAPRVAQVTRSDGQVLSTETVPQNIGLNEYFFMSFNQPMDQATTEAALSLTTAAGGSVGLKTSWNDDFTQVWITPTQRLALETQYLLGISTNAQGIAGGNVEYALYWGFGTIPYPRVQYTTPANGEQQASYDPSFAIHFVSPMNLETLKDRVVFSPAPQGELSFYYADWENAVYFNNALLPSTSYEVRLLPGMEDIYGNQLTQEMVIRFTTGRAAPYATLAMPYGPAIYRMGGPQQFYVYYRNITSLDLRLYRMTIGDYYALSWDSALPSSAQIWQYQGTVSGGQDQQVIRDFTPTQPDGSPLQPGLYVVTIDATPVETYGRPYLDRRLLVVSNASLNMKSTPTETLVWVTDLTTGLPLAGVPVQLFDESFQSIAQGSTGADGKVLFNDLPAPKMQYGNSYYTRYALAESSSVYAFAMSDWGSGVNPYDFGIWEDYYANPYPLTVYLYTDRPIYRPGQPVYFKGVMRQNNDLAYTLPGQQQVRLQIKTYDDETVYDQVVALSPFGTFSGEFTLDKEAALGYYSMYASLPGQEEYIGSLYFSVAEYRKPEFQVTVDAAQTDVLGGQNFTVNVHADYYSGGGLVDAGVNWTLTAEPYTFVPQGEYSRFDFGDFEWDMGYWWQLPEENGEVIAQGQGKTDASGKLVLTLPADLSDTAASRRLTLEAEVTDLSGNMVAGRTTVTAHRSQVYPGIRATEYVGQAGKEMTLEVAAVDWNSQPLAGQQVDIEVVERHWNSVQKQDAQGRVTWDSSVEEIPVAAINGVAVDGRGVATVSFTPPKGGVYRAKVTARDAAGNVGKASTYLWVADTSYIPWRRSDDRAFHLVADRDQYVPGDTAEILIASPFQGQPYALVTVERGHIRQSEVIQLTSNSQVYRLPITADMAPNVYVSVVIVKGVDDTNPRPDFRMGIAELKVDISQQALKVELTPDKTQASPGDQVTYHVRVTDAAGNPVQAEVSLSLSDLATLSLADPNSLPPLDFFYSRRALGVRTSVPIVYSMEDFIVDIQEYAQSSGMGMGSGGGKGSGDWGVIEIRQDFPDTAYWSAHLTTDAQGEAQAAVKLPDNLTTWRMDARAVTTDTRLGRTTLDLVSTKPVLIRPQSPRFFVVGDETTLGAAVHNNTDDALTVEVSLQATGITLNSEPTQSVQIPARQQAYVTWNVSVPLDSTRVDAVFLAKAGNYTDATRPTVGTLDNQGIPVYRYEVPETVGTSGVVLEGGTVVEAISLPKAFSVDSGDLTIRTSPSLAASMTDGLTYLEHYPYECVEQTVSKFLPNVVSTRALREAGLNDPTREDHLKEQVSVALQRLYNWQNPDGGWGWWGNQKSSPYTSAYVILGLLEASDAGYGVDDKVLSDGLSFLRRLVSEVNLAGMHTYELNRQAFLLYVLARGGDFSQIGLAGQLFDQRENLALYARAYLAAVFHASDAGDPRLQTLLADFNGAAILSATGTHWEEASEDWWNWNTDTRTTAIILSVLSQIDAQNPLNLNAVRWLMSNRRDGHWSGTQETAWTLLALTRWMVASGELQANYEFAIGLNGTRIGGGIANADTLRQTTELKVSVGELLKDQANRLAFARLEGPGNLYYTAHLTVNLPVEQVQALDQGIIVSRSYYRLDDRNVPVTEAQQGDLLLVKLTVVAPNSLHYVVVDDPLPAGFEAVDQSLNTNPQSVDVNTYSWKDLMDYGWGWWSFDHIELRDEKVVLSAEYLPAGTYTYSYLVRASTPGTFRVIPATAQEFYFPEVYGRGQGELFVVKP